jgi:hypothetical protein
MKLNRQRTCSLIPLLVFLTLFFLPGVSPGFLGAQNSSESSSGENDTAVSLEKNSLAWQLEEVLRWLIKTRDLVPRPKSKPSPFYALEQLNISGSVKENRFVFTLKGSVVADEPLLVPLFGAPHQVMLKNVTLNNQPAIVGFDQHNYYFVRTRLQDFTIKGELALRDELSFSIPGPVNLFSANLTEGRIIEGNVLPGLKNATIHLETGKKDKNPETDLPPIFQLARALRIQKDITFEYRINVRSGSEISGITLPLRFAEIVLDVPGFRGWKQANNELVVPVSGRNIAFTVQGRLPGVTVFEPDPRSSYEWWLIESDMEHRVKVTTAGKQVDSSESPIPKQLSSPKLFLLGKGQKIELEVQPLATLEALAVVITSQTRHITWTKDGDLVAEDRLQYLNNGVDYIPFDCRGKPIYFEIDGQASKILSGNPEKKDQVLIPLKKGTHSTRIQSITRVKLSLFGGLLKVPTASHQLTISRSTLRLGLPSAVIPLWFGGGQGIKSPVRWWDIFFLLTALLLAFLFFQGKKARIAGFVTLAGFYFIFPALYFLMLLAVLITAVVRLVRHFFKGWLRWVGLSGAVVAVLLVIGLSYILTTAPSAKHYLFQKQDDLAYAPESSTLSTTGGITGESRRKNELGQRNIPSQQVQMQDKLGNVYFSGKNVVEGVKPVALPMPQYDRQLTVSRELVTQERPLSPTLIYVTPTALYPFLLLWICCLVYSGFVLKPGLKPWLEKSRDIWKPGGRQ